MDVERGKPTAEMGLVLHALSALGMSCDIRRTGPGGLRTSTDPAKEASASDLNRILRQARGRPIASSAKARGTLQGVESRARPRALGVPAPDLDQVLTRTTGKRIHTIRFTKSRKAGSRPNRER